MSPNLITHLLLLYKFEIQIKFLVSLPTFKHFRITCQHTLKTLRVYIYKIHYLIFGQCEIMLNPPASEASTEVANLTEKKHLHTQIIGVKVFVCLSVVGGLVT